MKKLRPGGRLARVLGGSSRGMTLIEVLVALALFTIIAITFLSGLTVAARAVFIGDVRTTAESLARAQMEHVKSQDYNSTLVDGEASYGKMGGIPDGYVICSVDRDNKIVNCDPGDGILAVPWDSESGVPLEPVGTDDGLQRIKLVIRHDEGKDIFSLEGYKVDR
ncbi:MAG: prepilin-type N-terminal cleavage/methylation domain-containing protein [Dehalococcoidia bacterium]